MSEMGARRMLAILDQTKKETHWTLSQMNSFAETVWAITDGFMMYFLSTTPKQNPNFYGKEALKAAARIFKVQG
jgi:hypothetical protein